MKQFKMKFAINAALVLTPILCAAQGRALAATIQGINPEVAATVWQEDNGLAACVSLNGKELVTFHSDTGSDVAATKAEELACRLQELLDDKKFDANVILPARSTFHSTIQRNGSTVVSFDADQPASDAQPSPLAASWQLVNNIRAVYGVPGLPSSYVKLVEQAEQKLANKAAPSNCFSGEASWYGGRFHGRLTSDGHRYDQEKMTAAHRSLPFGTKVLVMNRKTGHSCIVEVNDRGPFVGARVIDLSRAAARQLKMLSSGVALVDCLILGGNL